MPVIRFYLAVAFIVIGTIACHAQQTKQWLEQLENPKHEEDKLKPENKLQDYQAYNFSSLFIPESQFLGYIGNDFTRIRMHYTSVTKDSRKSTLYHVKGYSIVHGNKCDFTGTIELQQVRERQKLHYGLDDAYKDSGIINQGVVVAAYKFREDSTQFHVGTFEGIMTMNWYLDKNSVLQIDDLEASYSDSYRNNQYIGTWIPYNSTKFKVCNWGEHRIPFSGDLDIGAGQFSPDKKYYKKGWEDFSGE